jgi:WD40 repeat protein
LSRLVSRLKCICLRSMSFGFAVAVTALHVSSPYLLLVCCDTGEDSAVKVWDIRNFKCLQVLSAGAGLLESGATDNSTVFSSILCVGHALRALLATPLLLRCVRWRGCSEWLPRDVYPCC